MVVRNLRGIEAGKAAKPALASTEQRRQPAARAPQPVCADAACSRDCWAESRLCCRLFSRWLISGAWWLDIYAKRASVRPGALRRQRTQAGWFHDDGKLNEGSKLHYSTPLGPGALRRQRTQAGYAPSELPVQQVPAAAIYTAWWCVGYQQCHPPSETLSLKLLGMQISAVMLLPNSLSSRCLQHLAQRLQHASYLVRQGKLAHVS